MQGVREQRRAEKNFYQKEEQRRKKAGAVVWKRDGDAWILLGPGRRRLGRVVRDLKHPDMWRSVRLDGQLSDMANLSWANNAVLIAAERELESEGGRIVQLTPRNPQ